MAVRDDGQNSSSTSNVLLAFAVGAIAGAAIALLYAPASGEETRETLKRKAREGRDKVRDMAERGRDFVRDERDAVVAAVEHGREAYEQSKHAPRGKDVL